MAERPILFSGPMVRALLDGGKTQTRRVVNPKATHSPDAKFVEVNPFCKGGPWWQWYDQKPIRTAEGFEGEPGYHGDSRICPYGQPGDRLWVRETWGYRGRSAHYNKDGVPGRVPYDLVYIGYQADGTKREFKRENDDEKGLPQIKRGASNDELVKYWRSWRPSIHMPRWASRLTLEIVSVRVERLQDISEADAVAEGVLHDQGWEEEVGEGFTGGYGYLDYLSDDDNFRFKTARESYRSLWESINGPGSWEKNPWVWVVEFRPAPEQEKEP